MLQVTLIAAALAFAMLWFISGHLNTEQINGVYTTAFVKGLNGISSNREKSRFFVLSNLRNI